MWIRFKRDRTGVFSAFVVLFFFVVAAAAPLISKLYGKDPYTIYADERPELFDSAGVPVQPNAVSAATSGSDSRPGNGYDVFTKLIYGIRTSLTISVAVTLAVVVTGILLGITAGYLGGKTDYANRPVHRLPARLPSQLFFIASMPVVVSLFVSPRDEDADVCARGRADRRAVGARLDEPRAHPARHDTRPARTRVHRGGEGERCLALADHPQGDPAERGDTAAGADHVHCSPVSSRSRRACRSSVSALSSPRPTGDRCSPKRDRARAAERHHLHVLPRRLDGHLVVAFNLLGDASGTPSIRSRRAEPRVRGRPRPDTHSHFFA